MSIKIVNLSLLLLYDFKSGLNATQSCQRINSAFGDGKIALQGVFQEKRKHAG